MVDDVTFESVLDVKTESFLHTGRQLKPQERSLLLEIAQRRVIARRAKRDGLTESERKMIIFTKRKK